jgi:hypothetical protein
MDPVLKDGEVRHYILDYGYHIPDATEADGVGFRLGNEPDLLNGKGYLMALSSESMMMNTGVANTGPIATAATNTPMSTNLPPFSHNCDDDVWRKLNLVGNPYQSYLDFEAFASANPSIEDVYATIDDSGASGSKKPYIYYKKEASENYFLAKKYIHPHQGFFVKVKGGVEAEELLLNFTNEMRKAGTSTSADINSPYRGRVNYPLVNLLCYDEDNVRDLITVEVNRPEFDGGHKMENLHDGKGMMYAYHEDEHFQILFAPVGVSMVPVHFAVRENGVFTMNWNTLHGNFTYLHLIDNLAGVDVDCLTADEYKFEGKTTDYKSRFKLVFKCDDNHEEPDLPDEPDEDDSDHFAFFFGDNLVVNGEGMLQMFDIQGRCLMETQLNGAQNTVNLPKVAAGLYLLRLTGDKQLRVQKMVIK